MIEVKDLSYGYDDKKLVLENINLTINESEIISILGANGCGKSTLLKSILGVIKPSSGSVSVNGLDISKTSRSVLAKHISYVPQSHNAVFPYKVEEVVIMGRSVGNAWKIYSKKDYEVVENALDSLKILHLKDRVYSTLSGGERQLVLVARALAQGAKFCLMDEPVASLDFGNQYRLLDSVKSLNSTGITFIITTHHPSHVAYVEGRAILLKDKHVYLDGKASDVINNDSIYDLYKVRMGNNGQILSVD